MNFLRKHWFDLGGLFAIITALGVFYFYSSMTNYQLLMWLSLVSLFLHQLEEYRIPGTFPGMVNRAMYNSDIPDRYPLNSNTSFYVNVFVGWVPYLLAAIMGEKAVWLGIATIIVSLGNTVAHTTVFNIKGKTIYNAGLATSWLLFAPCIYFFFTIIYKDNLVTLTDYLIGVPLGIILNVVGIIKLIDWLADKNTSYIFEQRNVLPQDRKK
ncbi:HXXEE domain-containing protein [Arachidicoccus sp.]|uniref:HXXEE domain-containing protein n=1 Tax=Arachidicoccus sp. TaxID=1872624 RepID=UPI003D19DAF1